MELSGRFPLVIFITIADFRSFFGFFFFLFRHTGFLSLFLRNKRKGKKTKKKSHFKLVIRYREKCVAYRVLSRGQSYIDWHS